MIIQQVMDHKVMLFEYITLYASLEVVLLI